MSFTEKMVKEKQEAAKRERARAEALTAERDGINRALDLRAQRAAATAMFAPDLGDGRLSSEQTQAFADSADEHLARAHELEYEAAAYGPRAAALTAERATRAADDFALVREKVRDSRDRSTHNAVERYLASAGDGGRMDDASYGAFMKSVRNVVDMDRFDEHLSGMEQRHRDRAAVVVAEPRVYGPDSEHSYFLDRATLVRDGADFVSGAQARMARYDVELAHEVRCGSEEGRRVERLVGEQYRQQAVEMNRRVVGDRQAELRALTSGGGATASAGSGAAAFVSPFFAEQAWAPYRGIHRTFADQCASETLPPYGLEVYIPAFTSATSTTQQTEGSAVSETDPSTGFQSAQVVAVSGQITISQQLSDRGFTGGGSFDVALGKQLQQQLNEAVEKYVIGQALAGASVVAGSSSYSTANLYADIAKAREVLTDTAGTRLRPTHFFSTSDLFSYVTRQVDDQHRPLVVPSFAPGFPLAAGDEPTAKWSRFTGLVLPGSLLWFTADAIPNVGTTSETQLIVSAPDQSIVLFEGAPILSVFPQTDAASLELIANLRCYCAAVTRYPSGTSVVAGPAYTSALV